MESEIIIAVVILLAMVFLATVDMAFSHLSDVGLRRISSEDDFTDKRSAKFLRDILENRQRFRFALSSAIQTLLIGFTVLLTVILTGFTSDKYKLFALALTIGLAGTVLLRQILPRLMVRNNTEKKLLFLLPAIRPIYALVSFFASPTSIRA